MGNIVTGTRNNDSIPATTGDIYTQNINANGKLTVGGPDSTYATLNIRNSDGNYTHIGVTGQPDRKFQNGSLFRGNVHMANDLNIDGNQRIEGNISMGGNSTFSIDAPGVVGGRFNIDKDGNVHIKGNLIVDGLVSSSFNDGQPAFNNALRLGTNSIIFGSNARITNTNYTHFVDTSGLWGRGQQLAYNGGTSTWR